MQNIFKAFLILATGMLHLGNPAQAQEVKDFSAYKNGKAVRLNWTLQSGNLCSSMEVERSTDGVSFYTVGQIPGICGVQEETHYFFSDRGPFGSLKAYYRLKLTGYSYSDTIEVKYPGYALGAPLIYPNPAVSQTTVFLNKLPGQKVDVMIRNTKGEIVYSQKQIGSEEIVIEKSLLPAGLYFFLILEDNNIVFFQKLFFL